MSHSAAHAAYGKVAIVTANPRELEARALLKAAEKLQAVHDTGPLPGPALREAIVFNRRLWTIFASGVAAPESPLPPALRAEIASLAAFVLGKTIDIEIAPSAEGMQSIIGINRNIAAGLLGSAA